MLNFIGDDGIATFRDGTTASTAYRTLISEATASNTTSVDFTSGFSSSYSYYIIEFYNVKPTIDGAIGPGLRVSTDGGTTFISTSNLWYSYGRLITNSSGWTTTTSSFTSIIYFASTAGGNSTDAPIAGRVYLYNLDTTAKSTMTWNTVWGDNSDNVRRAVGGGSYDVEAVVNGLRIEFGNSSNISTGTFKFFGVV